MTRLQNISAKAHSFGNRIDLSWGNPDPDKYPGVRLVRREGTHPISPDDGYTVSEVNSYVFSTDLTAVTDLDNKTMPDSLRQLFLNNQIIIAHIVVVVIEEQGTKWLISDNVQSYVLKRMNGTLHAFKKGIDTVADRNLKSETVYYYSLFPFKGSPPEYVFDRNNRVAAMATGPYNMAKQMYSLLPGIYKRYDTVLSDSVSEEDREKGELRRFLDIPGSILDQFYSFAKAIIDIHNIDKIHGRLLPLLAGWIAWKTDFSLEIESQRNEIRNAPALYKRIGIIPAIEATVKRISGWESRTKEFVHNVFLSNRPERLNFWLKQRDSSGVWSEPSEPLSLDFAYEGRPSAIRDGDGTLWLFYHTHKKREWKRDKTYREVCNIWYKTYREDREDQWSHSQPLTSGYTIDKYPSAVVYENNLRVFWSVYNEESGVWNVKCLVQDGGLWSECTSLPFGDDGIERKRPFAVTDDTGGLWLYWLERAGTRWQMKYNRHDGSTWGTEISFPLDGGEDPRVEGEPFILFHPAEAPARRIWVFWSRQELAVEPGQTRWTVVYRVKANTNLDATGWSGVQALSTLPAQYHDKEPSVFVNADGDIELFWSSNRNGSWSIRQRTLDVSADTWGAEVQVTASPFSQRDSFPLSLDDSLMLIYRSNKDITYTSNVYKATETTDYRYSGCTTLDTRNTEKIALRKKFDDFQAYTYDAGKEKEDWYARDTIGVYLKNDTMDKEKIEAGVDRIEKVLNEFMPITDRAVFITKQDVHTERVYTYGLPFSEESRFINETYRDILNSVSEEVVPGPGEDIS